MNQDELAAFGDSVKQSFALVESRAEFEKHLKPGDILVTSNAPGHVGGLAGDVLVAGIRTVYGNAGHASIYVGGGKTVEMVDKLKHHDLSNSLKNRDVTIIRPNVSAKQRLAAVRLLKTTARLEGDVARYASPGVLARSLVEDFTGKKRYADRDKELEEQKRYTCSNLIANAYKRTADLEFRDHKSVGSISPLDFIESKKVTRVATFQNPERHDVHRRADPALGGLLSRLRAKTAKIYSSQKSLLADLQPGDILTTTADKNYHDPKKKPLEWASEEVFKSVSRGLYGDKAHTSIYVGDGKVVEMFDKLQKVPLSKAVAKRDVWISRPKVPEDVRARAAARADGIHSTVGAEATYHSPPWLLKLLVNDKIDKRLFKADADTGYGANKFICSNLVAKAYEGDVAFTDKATGFHTPTDIVTSDKLEPVGTYLNSKRWDKERRHAS